MDPKYEFKKSIERIRHELLLVNNRVNWLIGSQTFFIGTYLILLDKTESNAQLFNAVNIVPIIGAIFAFVVYVGVMAALIVIRRTVREARNLDLIAYPDTYSASLLSPIIIPATFLAWWLYSLFGLGIMIISVLVILIIIFILLYKTRIVIPNTTTRRGSRNELLQFLDES